MDRVGEKRNWQEASLNSFSKKEVKLEATSEEHFRSCPINIYPHIYSILD